MIGFIREYTIQTIFVAIQTTIIVYGIAVTATFLKASGYPEYDSFWWFSLFVRHGGLLFLVIPAGWVWLTIRYEQSDQLHPTAFTIGTGVVVMILLWFILSFSAAGAQRIAGTIIQQASISEQRFDNEAQLSDVADGLDL